MEAVGIDEDVKAQIYKIASISLCSNIAGQVVVWCHTLHDEIPGH